MQKETQIGLLNYIEGRYGGEYSIKKTIQIFSKEYNIDICFDVADYGAEGLTDLMVTAVQNCLELFQNNVEIVETAIKEYYDTEVKERAEDDFCDYIEMDDASQLSQVMEPKAMYIQRFRKQEQVKDVLVGFYCDYDWNEEGFGIRFNGNGEILKVGKGDIVY